jgi:hypothetical protein
MELAPTVLLVPDWPEKSHGVEATVVVPNVAAGAVTPRGARP